MLHFYPIPSLKYIKKCKVKMKWLTNVRFVLLLIEPISVQFNHIYHIYLQGPGECCFLLEFTSSGSLASGVQNHVLGMWEFDSEGPDGRQTYIQPDNVFNPMYMYWYPPLQVFTKYKSLLHHVILCILVLCITCFGLYMNLV